MACTSSMEAICVMEILRGRSSTCMACEAASRAAGAATLPENPTDFPKFRPVSPLDPEATDKPRPSGDGHRATRTKRNAGHKDPRKGPARHPGMERLARGHVGPGL